VGGADVAQDLEGRLARGGKVEARAGDPRARLQTMTTIGDHHWGGREWSLRSQWRQGAAVLQCVQGHNIAARWVLTALQPTAQGVMR